MQRLVERQACRLARFLGTPANIAAAVRPRGRRKLKPAWWAPSGFAAIPTAALDPAHSPASPAVPALIESGSPLDRPAGYSASAGLTESISAMV